VDTAVQQASGGGKNVNDLIRQAAQIIAKQAGGVPLQNIESIIIQMALQSSKAQGKAITGQTIFEVANQIIRNPNGVLTQAIIQLAKQDTHDSGKTGQTVNVIKKVLSRDGEDSNRGGGGDNCFQRGYGDGEDHPFNQGTYKNCGDKYYKGFIRGCTSVKGNNVEICESATDVAPPPATTPEPVALPKGFSVSGGCIVGPGDSQDDECLPDTPENRRMLLQPPPPATTQPPLPPPATTQTPALAAGQQQQPQARASDPILGSR
jgi:hypothetical protein